MNAADMVIALVLDLLDGYSDTHPVRYPEAENKKIERSEPVYYRSKENCVHVRTDTLTATQRRELADELEQLADKCLERVLRITENDEKLVLAYSADRLKERREEFLKHDATVKRNNQISS